MGKKILGICATQAQGRKSTSEYLLDIALKEAKKYGASTDKICLSDYDFRHCRGCSSCMQLMPCPLSKEDDDDAMKIFNKMGAADAFIISVPVYGYQPPELILKLFHRFSPNHDMRNELSRYLVDVTSIVKGWPVMNKEVGIIAVAATVGMETTLQTIYAPLRGLRANVVISVGIGIMEYDRSPHIAKKPFSKDISQAAFAIEMAEAVGERVATANSGFDKNYKFKDPYMNNGEVIPGYLLKSKKGSAEAEKATQEALPKKQKISTEKINLYEMDGHVVNMSVLLDKMSVFVIGGPMAIEQNLVWVNNLYEKYGEAINIYPIAEVDAKQLPFPKEFIMEKIKGNITVKTPLVDWDVCFFNEMGINFDKKSSSILIVNPESELIFKLEDMYNEETYQTLTGIIDKNDNPNTEVYTIFKDKVTVNDIKLAYIKTGRGKPFLLLHGNRDTKDYFSDITKELSKHYQVYALDLRGHGESEILESGYALENFMSDVREFIAKMKFDHFNILGHSLGATLAMKIAMENPKVDDLVLMGTSAHFHPDFRPVNIQTNNITGTNLDSDNIKLGIQAAVAPYFFLEEYPQVMQRVTSHWREMPGLLHRALVMELRHPDMRDEISKVRNRTLVIAGAKDRITKPEECKFVADNIQGAEYQLIQNTGHFMYLEKPDLVINLVKKFLNLK
jgi:3-oxoadipate enol-lactonase